VLTSPEPPLSIVAVNQAWVDLCGFTRAEAIGRTCRMIQGPETSLAVLGDLHTAIAQKRATTVRLINYKKNGERFLIELTVEPLTDTHGRITHFHGVLRPIADPNHVPRQHASLRLMQPMKTPYDAPMKTPYDAPPQHVTQQHVQHQRPPAQGGVGSLSVHDMSAMSAMASSLHHPVSPSHSVSSVQGGMSSGNAADNAALAAAEAAARACGASASGGGPNNGGTGGREWRSKWGRWEQQRGREW